MKRGWWIALLTLPFEISAVGYILWHPAWAKAILRLQTDWLWTHVAPVLDRLTGLK